MCLWFSWLVISIFPWYSSQFQSSWKCSPKIDGRSRLLYDGKWRYTYNICIYIIISHTWMVWAINYTPENEARSNQGPVSTLKKGPFEKVWKRIVFQQSFFQGTFVSFPVSTWEKLSSQLASLNFWSINTPWYFNNLVVEENMAQIGSISPESFWEIQKNPCSITT